MVGGGGLRELEIFNDELWGVGSLSSSAVAKWTGSTWGSGGSFNTSHGGIFADGNDLYVGSDFGVVSKKTGSDPFVTLPAFDNTNDDLSAITKFNGEIIVAGKFVSSNGVTLNNIARWDGTSWQPLGSGIQGGVVRGLAVYDDELYACGTFSTAGGNNAGKIAKWDGSNWTDVGGSAASPTGFFSGNGHYQMKVHDNKLFLAGDFDVIGTDSIENVAVWDGNTWTDLRLEIGSDFPQCIEVFEDRLYVGTSTFGDARLYVLDLNNVGIEDPELVETVKLFPNPSQDFLQIEANFIENVSVKLSIVNLQGKQVYSGLNNRKSIFLKEQIDICDLSPGIYFFQINSVKGLLYQEKIVKK